MRNCYNCRKEHQDNGKILCEECEQKQKEGTLEIKASQTLVIYDKI